MFHCSSAHHDAIIGTLLVWGLSVGLAVAARRCCYVAGALGWIDMLFQPANQNDPGYADLAYFVFASFPQPSTLSFAMSRRDKHLAAYGWMLIDDFL